MRWPDLTDEQRFMAKVQRPADDAGCWTWIAAKNDEGYGNFFFRKAVDKAHRVAWIFANGEIPDGLCVLHRCDNPSCVNPAHLFLGSKLDNNLDKVAKGRHTWGTKLYCIRGHALFGANLYLNATGLRECRTCKRERGRVYDAARRPRKAKAA